MNRAKEETPLIVEQKNPKRTNCIKAKIDNSQQNSKCRLCVDETVNYIKSECNKLAQKEYKTRRYNAKKMILREIQIWPYYQMVNASTKMCGIKFSESLKYKRIQ